jgi:two-component sensor histidine kinase
LIDLQASRNQDEQVQMVFKETKNRVRSMALVHQKLYQSQNLSSIDLGEYIRELTALLMASYQITSNRISLVLDLQRVPVLIDTAVPCGLILNELISNVFKHAFPHNKPGELRITLKQSAEDEIMLQVADNGMGLPSGLDPRKSDSVGLQTVFGITEYQLQGKVTCKTAKGVSWQLRFSDTLYQPRV